MNNALPPGTRVRQIESQESKLLGAKDVARLDTGKAGEAIEGNSSLEAVALVNGSGRTAEGKARVARNPFKGGTWRALRALARLLREHRARMARTL